MGTDKGLMRLCGGCKKKEYSCEWTEETLRWNAGTDEDDADCSKKCQTLAWKAHKGR
jgi:hypothetical protein